MTRDIQTTAEPAHAVRPMNTNQRAFTLIELLVTIVIIALLLSLVAVAFGPFRAAANQTDSLGALRQMAMGFNSYTTDHAGQLLPGYLDASLVNEFDIPGRDRHGNTIPPQALKSYVWRLAPYVDHAWETMLKDYKEPEINAKATAAVSDGIYDSGNGSYDPIDHFLVAEQPSFGMNAIYVGGDAVHDDGGAKLYNPFNGDAVYDSAHPDYPAPPIGARRMSQIKNPGRLVVFGSVARADTAGSSSAPYADEAQLGTAELRAPYTKYVHDASPSAVQFESQQWEIGDRKQVMLGVDANFGSGVGANEIGGVPIMRWSKDKLPVAKVDGSTAGIDIGTLGGDMRHWAWQATGLHPPQADPPPS